MPPINCATTDNANRKMPIETDEAPTPHVPPIPTPDDDGNYTCDVCLQKVRVGGGGTKNFFQHRNSPVCLRMSKKTMKAAANQSEKKTITSFFPKVTTSKVRSSTAVLAACAPAFTSSPLSASDPPHHPDSETTQSVETQTPVCPDKHAIALLARLDRAAQNLPSQVPEAGESDDIARAVISGGPDDPAEAWEHLDHTLNRLVGYGVGVEEVVQRLRRGPLGIEGLSKYIRWFVVDYGVTGDLLEGKIGILLKAIEATKE